MTKWMVIIIYSIRSYPGAVMMSFNYDITPTHGNWFETDQPEHEWDDRVGNTVYFFVLPMRKLWYFSS